MPLSLKVRIIFNISTIHSVTATKTDKRHERFTESLGRQPGGGYDEELSAFRTRAAGGQMSCTIEDITPTRSQICPFEALTHLTSALILGRAAISQLIDQSVERK